MFNRKNRTAVNQLSMDIPRNQITVLLGHNGAGMIRVISISKCDSLTFFEITRQNHNNVNDQWNYIENKWNNICQR